MDSPSGVKAAGSGSVGKAMWRGGIRLKALEGNEERILFAAKPQSGIDDALCEGDGAFGEGRESSRAVGDVRSPSRLV